MANGGNPFVIDRLNEIREQNKDLYDQGKFDLLLDKFNDGFDYKIDNPGLLQEAYNYYDQLPPPIDDSEKKNPKATSFLGEENLDSDSQSEEEDSSLDLFERNKKTTKHLLDYIADLEAVGGSYNSYQGSFMGGAPQHDFENMTMKGVLDWQSTHKNKAVGRYQIKPQTLKEMMKSAGLTEKDMYSPTNQDKLGLELLKRAGYQDYLEGKGYEDFSLGLAKTWAALPLVFEHEGRAAGESYYEGQGSNRARSRDPKNIGNAKELETLLMSNSEFRSKYTKGFYDRANAQEMNELFTRITTDFMRNKSEEDFEVDFKKQYARYGFDVKQTGDGGLLNLGGAFDDRVIITHPSIDKEFNLSLEDFTGDDANLEVMRSRAMDLQMWMRGALGSIQPERYYGVGYEADPIQTLQTMANDYIMTPDKVKETIAELENKRELLENTPSTFTSTQAFGYGPGRATQSNPAYNELKQEIYKLENTLTKNERDKARLTRDFQNLADRFGGVKSNMEQNNILQPMLADMITKKIILPQHLKFDTILIDGRPSSLEELRKMTTDSDTRRAIWNEDIDIEIKETSGEFEGTIFEQMVLDLSKEAGQMVRKNTMGEGMAGRAEFIMRSTFAPLFASVVEMGADIGDALLDIPKMAFDLAALIPDKYIADADKVHKFIDGKTAAHYDTIFDEWRTFAQDKIRSVVPETSGSISDSESLSEFFQKGVTGAAESLPYFLAFYASPSVGLGTVGLSAYGSSINDAEQNQKLAQQARKNGDYLPHSITAFEDQSLLEQRGIAFSKSALETITTYAFTYRYFQNLTKIAKPGMDLKAYRSAATEYRRGFLRSYGNMFKQALYTETPEEILVSIENNAVDHIFGIREVSASQYFEDAMNAGGQALFSSTTMGAAGQSAKRSQSRDIVQKVVKSTLLDRTTDFRQLQSQLALINAKLESQKERGMNNIELQQQKIEVLLEIENIENNLKENLKGAKTEDLLKFAEHELEIINIVDNVRSSGENIKMDEVRNSTIISEDDNRNPNIDTNIKQRAEARLKDIVNAQQKIIDGINPKIQYKVSNDSKNFLNTVIVESGMQDDDELIYHSTVDVDGVLSDNKLKTNKQAKDSEIETLPDTPDQEGGADAVFFTRDGEFDLSDRNGRFIFSRNKVSQNLTPGKSKKEFELKSDGEVSLSRENGLVGIEIVEGKDISDEVFGEPYIKGKKPNVTEEENKRKVIELDKQNAENYFKNRKQILKRAQDAADKYGVPVVITQHRGNYKLTEAAGHKTYMQDEIVYPKNASEQDYANFGTVVQDQVRQTPAKTEQDQKLRNGAEVLVNLRKLASSRIPFEKEGDVLEETYFSENKEDAQGLIDFLRNTTYDDLSSVHKKLVDELVNRLSEVKSYQDVEGLGLSSYVNELKGSSDIARQIFMATPAEAIGKKTKVQTAIESIFTSKNELIGFADFRQALSNLFKNSEMKMPLLEINSNVDRRMGQKFAEYAAIKESYKKLEFLNNDPRFANKNKPTSEEYLNDENQTERRILSHLGKYEVKNLDGDKLVEDRQEQFDQKLKSYQKMIDEMADQNSPDYLKEEQKQTQEVFDRLTENIENYNDLEANAKDFNVAGVEFLRTLFPPDRVANFMKSMYGRTPTMFGNYLPTVTRSVKGTMSQIGMESDVEVIGMAQKFGRTPSNLKESGPQTGEYGGGLSFQNYDQVVLDLAMASQMQMDNMADILKMKGYFESKDFENLYEPGEQFGNIRDFALQILTQKIDRMNRVSSNEKVRASVQGNFRRLGNTLMKMTGVRRLGQLEMRAKQYYSATIAQLANLNPRSAQFLTEQIALFSVGMNTRVQKNSKYRNALISASLTSTRGGLSKTGMEPLYDLKYEKSKTAGGRAVQNVLDGLDKVSDEILRVTLTSTDVLAAQNTFLAFYMDYVTSRNPELADMTNDEFFEHAAKNIDTKAVAYADEQVGRSQTQSDEWNSRGIYGQGNSNTKRILANTLFTFGRFQNNRKVGIANDMSILNSDLASEKDKTQAANRLTSAAIEIGIFKILSPVIGVAYGQALMPLFSGILGFDEEVDEMALKAMNSFGRSGDEKVRGELEFSLSNYKRNISKEFGSALIDGMTPLPVPSVLLEYGFSGANALARQFGADEPFNVYSPYARGLFDNTGDGLTENDIASAFYHGAGLYSMAAEDIYNVGEQLYYLNTAKYPPYIMGGKDRYVNDFGTKASDLLVYTTLLNFIAPSANLNTFNRTLRGKLKRDYLTTKPSQRALKKEYQKQEREKEKIKQRQQKERQSFKPNETGRSIKDQYDLRRSLERSLQNN